jgi:multicomponent Na+:H+ antiporter subunit E
MIKIDISDVKLYNLCSVNWRVKMLKKSLKNQIILFSLLLAFWLIIVPSINGVQIIIGAVVALAITFYSYELDNGAKAQPLSWSYIKRLIIYSFKLIYEIIKANIEVALIVVNPKLAINPQFKKIRNPMKNDLNKVIYGNSITLTPGTITVVLEDDYIIIHALTDNAANSAEGGSLEKAVMQLEVKP